MTTAPLLRRAANSRHPYPILGMRPIAAFAGLLRIVGWSKPRPLTLFPLGYCVRAIKRWLGQEEKGYAGSRYCSYLMRPAWHSPKNQSQSRNTLTDGSTTPVRAP